MNDSDYSLPMLANLIERLEKRVLLLEAKLETPDRNLSKKKLSPGLEIHYSTLQVAKMLGYTPGHLRDLRVKNEGPRWIRLPTGMVRYPESAIKEYLRGETERK